MNGARRARSRAGRWSEAVSLRATEWAGSSWAFALASLAVLCWLASGPLFGYSDAWQLVINTGTTVLTFLMVFLIQRAQNKQSLALQLKLNELVAALDGASNRLIDVEDLGEDELEALRAHFQRLSQMSRRDSRLTASHTVEEAELRHRSKQRFRQRRSKPSANRAQRAS